MSDTDIFTHFITIQFTSSLIADALGASDILVIIINLFLLTVIISFYQFYSVIVIVIIKQTFLVIVISFYKNIFSFYYSYSYLPVHIYKKHSIS